ncbi:hypothetical protein FOL47_003408 [Perkinsus chesapeaki]|uniref:CRAL-TRIO domain-containing protein n=1 Tax=Perkinsus chesapeaki TaxID=330153 RepID=A0A7J6M8B0_PERCH|nr:hypothetical protein FOL47_003408 [Perkinsus chesapeaki]
MTHGGHRHGSSGSIRTNGKTSVNASSSSPRRRRSSTGGSCGDAVRKSSGEAKGDLTPAVDDVDDKVAETGASPSAQEAVDFPKPKILCHEQGEEWTEPPLSEEEKEVFSEVVKAVGSDALMVEDMNMLRFIRGYSHEKERVPATVSYLRGMLRWRKSEGADEKMDMLMATPIRDIPRCPLVDPECIKPLEWYFYGMSKFGTPVVYMKIPSASTYTKLGLDRCMEQHVVEMEIIERIKMQLRYSGWKGYKHMMVIDIKNVGLSHGKGSFVNGFKKQLNIDQYYYPEVLSKMVVVNAGVVISTLWKMVKPWVDPITVSRIKISGSHPVKAISEFVDPKFIPKEYGGEGELEPIMWGQRYLPCDDDIPFPQLHRVGECDFWPSPPPESEWKLMPEMPVKHQSSKQQRSGLTWEEYKAQLASTESRNARFLERFENDEYRKNLDADRDKRRAAQEKRDLDALRRARKIRESQRKRSRSSSDGKSDDDRRRNRERSKRRRASTGSEDRSKSSRRRHASESPRRKKSKKDKHKKQTNMYSLSQYFSSRDSDSD